MIPPFNTHQTLFEKNSIVIKDILHIFGKENINISMSIIISYLVLFIVIEFIFLWRSWRGLRNNETTPTLQDNDLPHTHTNSNQENKESLEESYENLDESNNIEDQEILEHHAIIDHISNTYETTSLYVEPSNEDNAGDDYNDYHDINFIDIEDKDTWDDGEIDILSLCKKATAFVERGQFSEAIHVYLKVLEIYQDTDSSDLSVRISCMVITSNICSLYFSRLHNRKKCIEYAKKTIKLLHDIPKTDTHYIRHHNKIQKILKEV